MVEQEGEKVRERKKRDEETERDGETGEKYRSRFSETEIERLSMKTLEKE